MTTSGQTSVTRVYDAEHRMPPIRPYLAETVAHLHFAYEKARLDLKAAHQDTWFGRLWNVLNPLLLGVVYWLLVMVIFQRGGNDEMTGVQVLTQILGGLFLYRLCSGALALGARSIVNSGAFVLNTRIPRLILPIGAVVSAFLGFAPSLLVLAVFHLIARFDIGVHLLWAIPIIVIVVLISFGMATIFATLNVYFRDVSSFLPYVLRIWLYLTPIIYLWEHIPASLHWALYLNPIGSIFAAWQQVLVEGTAPSLKFMSVGLAWGLALSVLGAYMFMRRERDFAIRI
jgi:teichoic acid transport system permease protein